jgi:F-type H+-transporting ATPase subunit epsilon
MYLEITSPDKVIFKGEVSQVSLPGAKGRFTVLHRHAPIISILHRGELTYLVQETENKLSIVSGLVEVNNDKVTVCVDALE